MAGNGPSMRCPVAASEACAVLQIKEVLRLTPRKRQTLLFSATMTEEVRDLAALSLQRPVRLAADAAGAAPKTLQQEIVRLKVKSLMLTCIVSSVRVSWHLAALSLQRPVRLADNAAPKPATAGDRLVQGAVMHGHIQWEFLSN